MWDFAETESCNKEWSSFEMKTSNSSLMKEQTQNFKLGPVIGVATKEMAWTAPMIIAISL